MLSATAIAGDLGEGMLGTIAPVKRQPLPGAASDTSAFRPTPGGSYRPRSTSHPGGARRRRVMLARPQYDLASREATVSGHAVQPTTRWPWPEEMNPTTARITGWSCLITRTTG